MTPSLNLNPSKICGTCKQVKPVDCFSIESRNPDGRSYLCKTCRSAYRMNIRTQYPERERELARIRYLASREKSLERNRKYTEQMGKRIRKNPERDKKLHRKWREDHLNQCRESSRKWDRENPGAASVKASRYRARRQGASINDFTAQQWKELQEACGHRCAYCHKRSKGKLAMDHIIPLSKGGNHTLSNIIPACKSCNSKKATNGVLCPVQPFLILGGS